MFVDSGAWIALAILRDPLPSRALEAWEELHASGARLRTSIPVVLETFTFLERNVQREVALRWKDSLQDVDGLREGIRLAFTFDHHFTTVGFRMVG